MRSSVLPFLCLTVACSDSGPDEELLARLAALEADHAALQAELDEVKGTLAALSITSDGEDPTPIDTSDHDAALVALDTRLDAIEALDLVTSDDLAASNFVTQSWIDAEAYATEDWVTGQSYATRSWVNGRDFATEDWVENQDYATEDWVSAQGGSSGGSGGIPGLASYLTVDTNTHDIIIEGANLHVRSGTGATDDNSYDSFLGTYNYNAMSGLGNLVIGYNTQTTATPPVTTGSHNLVLGENNSYTAFGGIVSGYDNSVEATGAAAIGGGFNQASGGYSAVMGGIESHASGWRSVVCGGENGTARGENSVTVGGSNGTAHGENSVTVGGQFADAIGGHDVALGGYDANTYLGTNFDISLGTRTGTTDFAWSNL